MFQLVSKNVEGYKTKNREKSLLLFHIISYMHPHQCTYEIHHFAIAVHAVSHYTCVNVTSITIQMGTIVSL